MDIYLVTTTTRNNLIYTSFILREGVIMSMTKMSMTKIRAYLLCAVFVSAIAILTRPVALAQTCPPTCPPVNVVTPSPDGSTGSLSAGHVPMATNTGMNDTFTITDIGSVPPHTYLGNNTTSSAESAFVQPNDGDIDPHFITNNGTGWTMTPGYYVYEVSTSPSGSVTWIWPPAIDYPHGKRVFFFDTLGLLSRQNPIVFQPTTGDVFNGNNIPGVSTTVSVPGSYVIGESDGSHNWSFNVVQPPPSTVQMTDFGAFPISIAGDSGCTWPGYPNTTVTCPNHSWSAAEIAQITAVGASNWQVVLQYADTSNADFVTTLGAIPTLTAPHDFTVATAPPQSNAGGPATQLRTVNTVTVALAGAGYNFGSIWQLVPAFHGS